MGLPSLPPHLATGYAAILALLIAGTLAAVLLPLADQKWRDLRPRMLTWWLICGVFGVCLWLGWPAFTLLMFVVSTLALREFIAFVPLRDQDKPVISLIYAGNLISYALIAINIYPYFLVFAPIYIFVAAAALTALIGETKGFLAVIGELQWGVITCVFFLGHVAFLMRTPGAEVPEAGPGGLVFFLLLITQPNDVAQYFWGKAIGRRKIVPRVSPNKTWEGAIGGWLTTTALFFWLAPYFTPLRDWRVLLLIGGVLPVLGFLGDITMSAIKRDLGVKDSSKLLPGHGGVLDRVDSLTFTAPWYFHMLAIFALQRF